MNVTAAWQARISRPSGSEYELAILRVVLVGLITIYIWGRAGLRVPAAEEHDRILLTGLGGWLILAVGIVVAICLWPGSNVPRRVLGMLADVAGTSFALFLAGESGATFVGIYLFIIFGNGFRYGRAYLHICQFLCLTGFALVALMAPGWGHHVVVGWTFSMLVLPFYVAALAERINAARVKAEEALKECVDRERRMP